MVLLGDFFLFSFLLRFDCFGLNSFEIFSCFVCFLSGCWLLSLSKHCGRNDALKSFLL